jgi:hypothetical protein
MAQHVKKALLATAVLLSTLTVSAQTGSEIIGQWKGEKEPERQMEFYLDKDGLYCAKAITSKQTEMVKEQVLLKKLKYDEASKTFRGMMSPPDANVELNATVTMISSNKLKIVAKKLVMSKTIYLIRVK